MAPIFQYTYFISVDIETDKLARSSRKMLEELLRSPLKQPYRPHITAFYYERNEDDEAVVRQALPVVEGLKAQTLFIKGVTLFPAPTKDAIVYTFQNPEWVNQLHLQLNIAHGKIKKTGIPHLTIAKGLPKLDPIVCTQLPSLFGHPTLCTSIAIVTQNVKGGLYMPVHKIILG